MSDERWVVLGLAHPRAPWFSAMARWSTAAAIPVDFIKCVSADEARARLSGGRPFSCLLVGGDVGGLDRDLVDTAHRAGATVVVAGPPAERDWDELGVSSVLPATFERDTLMSTLREFATPIARIESIPQPEPLERDGSWRGRLIAVTGAGGVGTSVTAMSVAQAFAAEPSNAAMVLLADLALNAEQAMLHDAREVVPGVQEFCEAHRTGRLPVDQVRSFAFDAAGRGYHLLLGLRCHRDWTAVRPRAFAASIDGMQRSYRLVIADIDSDTEGEESTGSLDVEDRNAMARQVTQRADLLLAVGNPTTKGLYSLARVVRSLLATGVDPGRIVAVCNRSPRSPRKRAESVRTIAELLGSDADDIGNPVFLGARSDVDDAIRDGRPLSPQLGRTLHAELVRRLDTLASPVDLSRGSPSDTTPELVTPGSIGAFTEEAG